MDTVDAVEQGIDAAFRLALGALLAMLALIVLLLAWHQPEPVAPIAATPDEYGWQI